MTDIVPKRSHIFSLLFLIIIGFALALRLYHLSFRPFHNDEGVNYFFITQILDKGYYPYSHENYHGPSYFYLLTACFSIFGDSEWAIRLSAVIPGMFIIFLLAALRRIQGERYVLCAALLVALSSSAVFYGRYAIHETLYLYFSLMLAIGIYLYGERERPQYLFWIFPAIAFLITTKETFIILLACLAGATLSLRSPVACFLVLKKHTQALLWSLLLSGLIVIFVFTAGFHWLNGLHEMFLAVPQWIGRNSSDTGHFKPFGYYLNVLVKAEPTAILALLAAITYILVNSIKKGRAWLIAPEQRYLRFVTTWAILSTLSYSLVSYKTTWLIINLTLPIILAGAYVLTKLPARYYGLSLGLISVLSLGYTLYFNYPIKAIAAVPYSVGNPYSYVHTSPGMRELVSDIEHYMSVSPRSRLLIGVSQYWPLPYYLRRYASNLAYLNTSEVERYSHEYDILIVDQSVNWQSPNWVRKYYRISEVQESYTYYRVEKNREN